MSSLEQQMRDMARGEIEGELVHYLDDMDWDGKETLERLVEWWDEQDAWHPNSKEVKSIKRMLIEFDVVEETTDEELAKTTVYSGSSPRGRKATEWFKMDGNKYVFDSWEGLQ